MLVLGGRDASKRGSAVPLGWHQRRLKEAADEMGVDIRFADYESIVGNLQCTSPTVVCDRGDHIDPQVSPLSSFQSILTRTMPAGSLEQITFRLTALHQLAHQNELGLHRVGLVNPPAALEIAIDKYATLARIQAMGMPVPETMVSQGRAEAMEAFECLGGDVVVKPIFGGEGRGVMRVRDRELAWTVFSTLEQIDAVAYVQQFKPPGGSDIRLLVIGNSIEAIARTGTGDFRTNVKAGGQSERVDPDPRWCEMARSICDQFGLKFAAIDFIETDDEPGFSLLEVNAIPGWRAAQAVVPINIARCLVETVMQS